VLRGACSGAGKFKETSGRKKEEVQRVLLKSPPTSGSSLEFGTGLHVSVARHSGARSGRVPKPICCSCNVRHPPFWECRADNFLPKSTSQSTGKSSVETFLESSCRMTVLDFPSALEYQPGAYKRRLKGM